MLNDYVGDVFEINFWKTTLHHLYGVEQKLLLKHLCIAHLFNCHIFMLYHLPKKEFIMPIQYATPYEVIANFELRCFYDNSRCGFFFFITGCVS